MWELTVYQRKVPEITPIEIAFENRSYVTEGNKPLLDVIPIEAMALIVDPQHPNYQAALAKPG